MDTNGILKEMGYGKNRFPEIAKWVARKSWVSVEQLKAAVVAEFGAPEKRECRVSPAPYKLFLAPSERAESTAIEQLRTALKLPNALYGAGMPDLHPGYSLPIGSAVVLDGVISPAFVGYDIGCRMAMTILDGLSTDYLDVDAVAEEVMHIMLSSSSFGLGAASQSEDITGVMDDPRWKKYQSTRSVFDTAVKQLGSSGASNHFFDLVVGETLESHPAVGPKGSKWTAILTHSGSRGAGNKVAQHYTALADTVTRAEWKVPVGYGWLDMQSAHGIEYYDVMRLMDAYASANHKIIHTKFLDKTGLTPVAFLENTHNLAWVDADGTVVHRKGATPAGYGEIGIIPGSSGTDSYVVMGLGNPDALYSASHGAGRPHSRTKAKELFQNGGKERFTERMQAKNVLYHGVAEDETFMAYKDIDAVIQAQVDAGMIKVLAKMSPRVVIMGGSNKSDDGD